MSCRHNLADGACAVCYPTAPYPSYVETWRAIGALCGRSERWCRYMSRQRPDPLPVYKVGGVVRLSRSAWDAWLSRASGKGITEPRINASAVTFRRGEEDALGDRPPAESTSVYLRGYRQGLATRAGHGAA